MNLEGYINFRSDRNYKSYLEKTSSLIKWQHGYLKITLPDVFNSSPFRFLAGIENNIDKEVEFLSNYKLGDLTSFSHFIAELNSSSTSLGMGIWYDIASNKLFLVREAFGMLPLYYIHVPNEFVAFSTSLVLLTSMLPLKSFLTVNSNRIASYCIFRNDQSADYTEDTFYENIKSVLPGHITAIDLTSVESKCFVKFNPDKWKKEYTTEDYGSIFKNLLLKSVRNNVKDESQLTGSHLSGGLDSSSISALVKMTHPTKPLHTFYYSTHDDYSNDYTYAQSVAEKIGSIHHYVTQTTQDLELIQLYSSIHGHPQGAFISPTSQGSLMQLASELGCKVLLNGNDGDSIVGSGLELIEHTYKLKNWQLLKSLLRKRVQYFSLKDQFNNWESLSFEQKCSLVEQNFIYNRLASQARSLPLSKLYSAYQEVSQHFELTANFVLKKGITSLKNKLNRQVIPSVSILRNDFFESHYKSSINSNKLSRSLRADLSPDYQQWFEDVYNRQAICNNEERFTLANHYGFSNRSPFYDKELFEFCMSVPALVKYGDGQGRVHFRDAMKGILPEHVRIRHQKATVGTFGRKVTLRLYDQSKELLMDSTEIWAYVDKNKFLHTLRFLQKDGLPNDQYNRSIFHITKTISLAVWLDWLKSTRLN